MLFNARGLKRLIPFLLCALLPATPATAQTVAETSATLPDEVGVPAEAVSQSVGQKLDELAVQFRALDKSMREQPEAAGSRLKALLYRQDQRALALLKTFSTLSKEILKLPAEDPSRGELAARLAQGSGDIDAYFGYRLKTLEARIDAQLLAMDALSGVDRVKVEAEIEALNDQRLEYLQYMIDIVAMRSALNFPPGSINDVARTSLDAYAEELIGEIEIHAAVRDAIKVQLAEAPEDADLKSALEAERHEAKRAVTVLDRVVEQQERLGEDTTQARRVLIGESSAVAVSLVDADVIGVVLEELGAGITDWLKTRSLDLGFQLLLFIGVLLLARWLARFARSAARRGLESQGDKVSRLLVDVTVSLVGGIVLTIGFLVALNQLGISVAPMLAGLGVAGFIVGFALQDTLSNFAAGGMILLYRPFDTGDYIAVAGVEGTVKKMNLVSTSVATIDNQVLIIPNSKIWGDVIRNITGQRLRRVDLEFGISYSDSIEQAEALLHEILGELPAVLRSPEPIIRVHRLGESSVDFIVRPWVRTEDYWETYWTLQRTVKLRFDAAGITIPFPQREVHVNPAGAEPSA